MAESRQRWAKPTPTERKKPKGKNEHELHELNEFMEIPEIPLTDPNAEPIKIEFPDADKFLENLEKCIEEYREKILECVREGKPMPKPYFRARRKDFTKVYECDEYKCDAHPRGCFFCKHNTDVFWDYTNGPYMIICELQKENDQDMPTFGCYGECKHFEE